MSITLEQLLATLSVDAASASVVAGRYVLVQRDPQPDETGIPPDCTAAFVLVDLDGDPAAAPPPAVDFQVWIDGVLAGIWAGGVWVPGTGWSGAVTVLHPLAPFVGWACSLAQTAPPLFTSEQLVRVEVVIAAGPAILYQFTIADITPPRLIAAEMIDQFSALLTFDDAMAQAGPGAVLTLLGWAVQRLNVDPAPGVSLEVVGVAAVPGAPEQAVVTFQWEATPGCLYEIAAPATVEDDAGNAIAADGRTAHFLGWQPEIAAGRHWDIWSQMIPLKNRDEDAGRDLRRLVNCWQETLNLLTLMVDRFTDLVDPDVCSDEQIDLMLYDMGNPFAWAELDLTPLQRRKLLRILVAIYQLKGTAVGIEDTVYFLLGEVVRVVDALAEGWVLGVDALGDGIVAEVLADAAEPYDFSAAPLDLLVAVDSGAPQTVPLLPGDFAAPAAATAAEVALALTARLMGAGAHAPAAGTPASMAAGLAEPYALAAGDALQVRIDGTLRTVTMHAADIATPGAATAAEVAARCAVDLAGWATASAGAGAVTLRTLSIGLGATLETIGGTMAPVIGFPPGVHEGTDAARVAVYSLTAGTGAEIQVTGGSANAVLQFSSHPVGGTGAAILGPDDQFTLYSFDIETTGTLPAATVALIRRIAEYLKPAHTHLVRVRPAPALPGPLGWTVGVSALDTEAVVTV